MQPTIERSHPSGLGGTQRIYRFPNGYGASVLDGPMFYTDGGTKFELGVFEYESPDDDADVGRLTYATPITDDVLGYLTWAEVEDTLTKIAALPSKDGFA